MSIKHKVCKYCKSEIPKLRKRCPYCRKYQYKFITEKYRPDKNIAIKKLLRTGDYSLNEVGRKFKLSRERIRQIWGKEFKLHRIKDGKKRREKLIIFLNSVKFNCKACKIAITYKEGKGSHLLCKKCWRIRKVEGRNPYIIYVCDYCKKNFHPFDSSLYTAKVDGNHFDTMSCYIKFKREVK